MRIAVTGASGFCGAAVARLADAGGHDVVCVGRRPGPVGVHVSWDASRELPAFEGVDAVLHLAAAVGDPRAGRAIEAAYRAVNVGGTERLFAAAAGIPVVWVSSASVYRPGPYSGAVGEGHPTVGQLSAYGRTKAAGERLALAAGAVVLRPRAVYGEGDRHLLPRLRRVVRAGRAWLPGPDVAMSLTAVENLAAACLAALSWPGGAYNIADAEPYRRDDVVGRALGVPVRHVPAGVVRGLAQVSPTLSRYAVDQLTDGMVLDIGRARAQGYRPEVTWS
ncbi:NAD-dependent epimerase/dehydratase family protein [Winogradskya humida]|uniref:NAD-dependent epimerase n=1 Tax=Winogradskya humida TaxID=113566 RepID=A0ABQ3ZPW9_9ACTN|nr:NAD(P)-dependent oxidoreductase [Actinoplanes humidus]GIE20564.1 NAD-dependent epimerase [Actinoplanes humidus]